MTIATPGDETILTADYADTSEALAGSEAATVNTGGLLAEPTNDEDESALPDWLRESRARAWREFQTLALPARTEQAWRFSTLGKIDLKNYQPAQPISETVREKLIARSAGNRDSAGLMVFANDRLIAREVYAAELAAQGVLWLPLDEAARAHGDLFRRHFMTQEILLGSKKFAALHAARVRAGTFLYVPKNVEVALPLEVFHWLGGGAGSAVFPHTLLIAEAGSKVTLVDYYESERADAGGFACGVNDLVVGPGAQVTYLCAQNWNEKTVSFQINTTTVERDAKVTSLHLNLGAAYARLESLSRLVGAGGRSDMLAATVANGTQEFDQRTLQDHVAPHTTSDLLYKNSLSDTARTIFAGLIRVEPQAQATDAYQKVRNLLLSEEAEANSMPGLEILADEVRCTHGATSGAVDAEEMFYLLSRGIDPLTARQLIVFGFLNEIVERLGDERVAGKLTELLRAKFERLHAERRQQRSNNSAAVAAAA